MAGIAHNMEKLIIRRLRYLYSSAEPLRLHHDFPVITFRGALGYALAYVIATQEKDSSLEEQVRVYKSVFMPQNEGQVDSQNSELARPFVLRGGFVTADKREFILETLLFGMAEKHEELFDKVNSVMALRGIGTKHQICSLTKLSSEIIYPMPDPELLPRLIVKFVSPCSRLKSGGVVYRDELPFGPLCARLIDRVEELNRIYGDGIPFNSFEKIGELKRMALLVDGRKIGGGRYGINRKSGRTGDEICMDGFLGTMEYHGDFRPFREYLRYLPFINLGRFNVFGCGWCKVAYLN